MLWLITSVVVKGKVCYVLDGEFLPSMLAVSYELCICIMLNSIDDFFLEEQSMQLIEWLSCKV